MKTKDYNKIINKLIGDEFEILQECTDDSLSVELRHKKCGHVFVKTASEIARSGIRCNRCYAISRESAITDFKEQQALQTYDKLKKKLGAGFEIKGDTSDLNNTIEIHRIGRDYFMITIDDLLNNRNLPEYLVHCTLKNTSIQFKLLQDFAAPAYELLEDFSSYSDMIKIRDNKEESIFTASVKDFISKVKIEGRSKC